MKTLIAIFLLCSFVMTSPAISTSSKLILAENNMGLDPLPGESGYQVSSATDKHNSEITFNSYHPLLVHFPIVLIILSCLLHLANLFLGNRTMEWIELYMLGMGVIGTVVATYLVHPHAILDSNVLQETYELHKQFAQLTVLFSTLSLLIVLIRVLFNIRSWTRWIILPLLVLSAVFVSAAGHQGSKLTHVFDVQIESSDHSHHNHQH